MAPRRRLTAANELRFSRAELSNALHGHGLLAELHSVDATGVSNNQNWLLIVVKCDPYFENAFFDDQRGMITVCD